MCTIMQYQYVQIIKITMGQSTMQSVHTFSVTVSRMYRFEHGLVNYIDDNAF